MSEVTTALAAFAQKMLQALLLFALPRYLKRRKEAKQKKLEEMEDDSPHAEKLTEVLSGEDDEDDAFILSSEKEVKITSNYTKMTADLGVDDGIDEEPHSSYKRRAEERQHRYRDYVKPQGLKSWPVIFSLPTTFATSSWSAQRCACHLCRLWHCRGS